MNRGEISPISGSVVEVSYADKTRQHAAYGVRREEQFMTLVYSELFPTRSELLATTAPADAALSPDKHPITVELSYGETYQWRDEKGRFRVRVHGQDDTTHEVAPYQAHHDKWIGVTPKNSDEEFHVKTAKERKRLGLVTSPHQAKTDL